MKAIQDYYPEEFAHCFGCGYANPKGLHLKSYVEGNMTVARFTADASLSGGHPGNAYGGLIASLLDCHGTASAAAFAYRERARAFGDDLPAIRFVTASLKIDYKRPTPLGVELVITGELVSLKDRKAIVALSLTADGKECATGEMVAVEPLRSPAATAAG